MNFTMTTPCDDCPFRRVGGIRLSPEHVEEIAGLMLDSQGGTFPCHKSVDYGRDGGSRTEVHCAGALMFAEKNKNATQMMRIAERLRMYDAQKLMTSPAVADVFDDMNEMLETAID